MAAANKISVDATIEAVFSQSKNIKRAPKAFLSG